MLYGKFTCTFLIDSNFRETLDKIIDHHIEWLIDFNNKPGIFIESVFGCTSKTNQKLKATEYVDICINMEFKSETEYTFIKNYLEIKPEAVFDIQSNPEIYKITNNKFEKLNNETH